MAAPRPTLNPATQSVGFTAKMVTVRSISADGKQAVCVDRQNVQTTVTMLVQRSKAQLPAVGETWLLTQDLGMWSFAAIVASSAGQFAGSSVVTGGTSPSGLITVSASPPAVPVAGDLWISGAAGNEMFQWTGTAWAPVQLGTQALADGSVTAAKVAAGSLTSAQLSPAAGIMAGQVAFSASDIGGTRVITGTSQPVAPVPGTVWINPAQGNAVMVWNGSTWTAAQFGAPAIAPGSLTATQIAANAGITAQQVAFSVTDIGGTVITFAATPPASPGAGDLWYDSGHGYRLSQWTGSAWVPYQFGTQAIAARSVTAELIAADTITAAQIAAGTITGNEIIAGVSLSAPVIAGGLISAAVFQGTNWVASAAGQFFYSGSPAPGALRASIAPGNGTDPYGNPYLAGVVAYFYSGTTPQWASILDGGDLSFRIWNGTSWAVGPVLSTDTSGDLLIGTAGGFIQFTGQTQFVNGIYTSTAWTTVASFNAGFSGTGVQYALMPQGVGGSPSVALQGEVILTGTTAADSAMFSVPFAFSRTRDYVTPNNLSGYTAGQRVVRVASSGNIRCEPSGSNTNFVILDGIIASIT